MEVQEEAVGLIWRF